MMMMMMMMMEERGHARCPIPDPASSPLHHHCGFWGVVVLCAAAVENAVGKVLS